MCLVLTEAQVAALEKAKLDKETHGEFERDRTADAREHFKLEERTWHSALILLQADAFALRKT